MISGGSCHKKTEAMAAEDYALPSLIIINTFILNSKHILQYYCNATFFPEHKILYGTKLLNSGVYV